MTLRKFNTHRRAIPVPQSVHRILIVLVCLERLRVWDVMCEGIFVQRHLVRADLQLIDDQLSLHVTYSEHVTLRFPDFAHAKCL
jgi:hypothetical protein